MVIPPRLLLLSMDIDMQMCECLYQWPPPHLHVSFRVKASRRICGIITFLLARWLANEFMDLFSYPLVYHLPGLLLLYVYYVVVRSTIFVRRNRRAGHIIGINKLALLLLLLC